MEDPEPTMAEQIANAARQFQQQCTGIVPAGVSVCLSDHTLVITLHGALSAAEKTLVSSPDGAAKVREFHRQLFASSAEPLRQEIRRIMGVEVLEAAAEIESSTGTVIHVFTSGTMVQIFLLARGVPAAIWNGNEPGNHS